jgi:hypothetical protein
VVASRLRTVAAPVLMEADGRTLVRQLVPLALVNRSGEERTCTLSLPTEPGATILLAPSPVILPPDRRLELAPVIDLPRERFAGRDLATTLVFTITGATTGTQRMTLPIILHHP